jgi:hypothetical protein
VTGYGPNRGLFVPDYLDILGKTAAWSKLLLEELTKVQHGLDIPYEGRDAGYTWVRCGETKEMEETK